MEVAMRDNWQVDRAEVVKELDMLLVDMAMVVEEVDIFAEQKEDKAEEAVMADMWDKVDEEDIVEVGI